MIERDNETEEEFMRRYLSHKHLVLRERPDWPELRERAKALSVDEVPEWAWEGLADSRLTLDADVEVTPEWVLQLAQFGVKFGIGRPRGGDESGEFEVPAAEQRGTPT